MFLFCNLCDLTLVSAAGWMAVSYGYSFTFHYVKVNMAFELVVSPLDVYVCYCASGVGQLLHTRAVSMGFQ